MARTNILAVVVATILAFVASSLWYSSLLFGPTFLRLSQFTSSPTPSASKALLELGRTFVLAAIVAYLVRHLRLTTWLQGLRLGLLLWVGFPVVLLTGSILWQAVPWQLAAIHSGDWLVKLTLIPVLVACWRRQGRLAPAIDSATAGFS